MTARVFLPESLDDALRIMAESEVVPVAGGTDLMVRHRGHGPVPVRLSAPPLFVGKLPELREIAASARALTIGAAVTLTDLAASEHAPAGLRKIIAEFASPAIRNSGTVGGNICNASPAADTLPFFYARGASVVLANATGERVLPISEFITGPGRTAARRDELLVRVTVPPATGGFCHYRKVAPRRSNALSKLSVYAEAGADLAGDQPRLTGMRLALGAVAPVVVRVADLETLVEGASASDLRKNADEWTERYRPFIRPIDDQRSTETYRRNTSLALIRNIFTNELPSFLERT